MRLVAHDHGRGRTEPLETQHGLLQQGVGPGQGQQLLGIELTRERPQACTGAAAENDWSEHGIPKEAAASRLNQRLAAPDGMVSKTKAAQHARIVEIASVENDRRLEDLLQTLEIRAPKLRPLGDDRERIPA